MLDLSNFVIFVQSSAIVNTETSPLSALMIHSLQVQTLLLVSNQLWDHIYLPFLSHKLSSLFVVSRTQEVDVSTQLRLGVRLLQAQARMCVQIVFSWFFLFSPHTYMFILLGMERILASATPVSFKGRIPSIIAEPPSFSPPPLHF